MGKLINSTYITLDGVVENPHEWPSPGNRGDTGDKIQTELLLSCEALIMGRRTYEIFAPVWPTRSGDPMSDKINTMRKFVVSTTLTDPDWDNTVVISSDPVSEIAKLKEEGDVIQYGFGKLTSTLMEAGLFDELRLWVHPQFLGGAPHQDLISPYCTPGMLSPMETTTLENGIVILSYELHR